MEPFRPLVDQIILTNSTELLNQEQLNPGIKHFFADILRMNLKYKDGEYVFPAGIAKFVSSYVQSLETKKPELDIPKIF